MNTTSYRVVCWVCFCIVMLSQSEAKDCLWRIKNGNSTFFLMGDYVPLKSTVTIPDSFQQAFTSAQNVVFEADLGTALSQALTDYFNQRAKYPTGITLRTHISSRTYQALGDFLVAHGRLRSSMDAYRPFFASDYVRTQITSDEGYLSAFAPSNYFYDRCKTAGKGIFYLETIQYEIDLLAGVPDADGIRFLDIFLFEKDKVMAGHESMIAAWKSGDVITLRQLTDEYIQQFFYFSQLVNRAEGWMPTIEGSLGNGVTTLLITDTRVLVATGGLLDRLKAKGYLVEQMPIDIPPVLQIRDLHDSVAITLTGTPKQRYYIEIQDYRNWKNAWVPIKDVTLMDSTFIFSEYAPHVKPQRYYRARQVSP